MLFVDWEVRVAKKCDRGLENAALQGFKVFTIQTDPKPSNIITFFFPAINWLTSGFTRLCY